MTTSLLTATLIYCIGLYDPCIAENTLTDNCVGFHDNRRYHIMLPTVIDTSCDSGTSRLETYNSNFITSELYAQKCLKYRKSQYWPTVKSSPKLLPI